MKPRAALFSTNQDIDPAALRKAFGIFPTGVVAVAAQVDDELIGVAASSFTSVSLDPPLVSFSIANTSKTWPARYRSSAPHCDPHRPTPACRPRRTTRPAP